MADKSPKILFVTPGASSVGGNIFLLNFLRWLKRNSDLEFITVYGHGGDLEEEFAELSPAYNLGYEWDEIAGLSRIIQKFKKRLGINERKVARKVASQNIKLIYSNAVINYDSLALIDLPDVPVISHCHELETLILKHGLTNFEKLKDRTGQFVAVAEAVKQNLITNHNVEENKIEVIHEFIPMPRLTDDEIDSKKIQTRSALNIPADAFVVGASGTMYWRKGPDLFIQIAAKLKSLMPAKPVYFLWIGGSSEGSWAQVEAGYDTEKLGISDRVRFISHNRNPLDYFSAIDVFALVSREDPFPLVCLEAASLGKPIICFADSGGMPEFVENNAGYVVPYLDLDAFAEKITYLSDHRDETVRLGTAACAKVRARHDIEVSAPRVLEIIQRYMRNGI